MDRVKNYITILVALLSALILIGYCYWLVAPSDSSNDDIAMEVEAETEEPDSVFVDEEFMEIDNVEEAIPAFKFEAYRYYRSSEDAEIELKADFPLGESIVADSVRRYIHEFFGAQYRCSLKGPQAIVDYYGDIVFRDYEKEHQEIVELLENADNEDSNSVSAYRSWSYFKVDCIEDKYVTYKVVSYFWTGGIHGLGREYGVTFNRTTGKQFNYSYFKNLESSSFKQIIKAGLKRYFQENDWAASNDKELADCLLDVNNVNNIPLPSADPYFTPKGVCFKYHSYEISPYAAGFPSFVLPYDEARPYLTEEALSIIKDEKMFR